MTTHDHIAGVLALPVVVALAFVEPALGLAVGFAVFASARKALPLVRRPRRSVHRLAAETTRERLAA